MVSFITPRPVDKPIKGGVRGTVGSLSSPLYYLYII